MNDAAVTATDPRIIAQLARLHAVFDECRPAAIALSGGVDSMTLAFIAHRHMDNAVTMFHAVSPAVPAAATERVKRYATRERWQLRIADAGEFTDENYLSNPANRCFYCKTNLYATLAATIDVQLFSGTNLDDLGDWRPGLKAAEHHAVRHPYVEAQIDKRGVRSLANAHGLLDLADLPAAPCLSSRVETGIRIDAGTLAFIDSTESLIRDQLAPDTVRCRVRGEGIVIELDEPALAQLGDSRKRALIAQLKAMNQSLTQRPIEFTAYRRGSAFLRDTLE